MTDDKKPVELTRLSVNLNEETAEALREIADSRGISFTEAVRRSIGVYKAALDEVDAGRVIRTSTPNGKKTKEWILH